ncbi:MAG: WD40/YVTN/BNR-like repeat-containing protein [Hyphomicrobiales bacterium]
MSEQILVSTRKGLFTVARKSGAWAIDKVDFLADNVSIALHDRRTGTSFAALDHGHFGVKLHRTKADGSWEECATPAFPPKPDDLVDTDRWGKPLPWSVVRVWSLEAGGADEPGLLWCGTIPGGLFRSHDNGSSWELVRSLWDHPGRKQWFGGGADLPGIHSICVDPRSSKTVRLGVSCGGVWQTDDGGKTWNCRAEGMRAEYLPPDQAGDPNGQDPHLLAQSAGAPDRLWVQHHNGIFQSRDGSKSWMEVKDVKPSSFGFAVAVHPEDGDTAWFVPGVKDEHRIPVEGKLVVTRTRDGGKTFEILRDGLPQEHAYDLIYRHALAIDETGDRLAFGSTTGGLWISENQGDQWACVSHTLPPVHAVRFA